MYVHSFYFVLCPPSNQLQTLILQVHNYHILIHSTCMGVSNHWTGTVELWVHLIIGLDSGIVGLHTTTACAISASPN